MPRKKKSKSNSILDNERPMPDIEARKDTTVSVKSLGVSKEIKCDKCNHIMNFQHELIVDKKGGVNIKCIPCMLSVKKKDQEMSVVKKQDGDMTIETNDHLVNVSFNREIT